MNFSYVVKSTKPLLLLLWHPAQLGVITFSFTVAKVIGVRSTGGFVSSPNAGIALRTTAETNNNLAFENTFISILLKISFRINQATHNSGTTFYLGTKVRSKLTDALSLTDIIPAHGITTTLYSFKEKSI